MNLNQVFSNALSAPDRREIYTWATEHVELPPAYAVTGRLDISRVPFVRAPLEALRRPTVRTVILMSGVQCLKTLIGELWLLHTVCENPGPTQWLQPTDQDAFEHAEERFNALLAMCPLASSFFSENRHEKKVASVIFNHMFLRMEGAENIRNLQRKSIKNQLCSEAWLWKPGHLGEAAARLTQFTFNSKRLIESQAGNANDDLDQAWQGGSQEVWHFACPLCGFVQRFVWSGFRADGTRFGVRWDETPATRRENGDWNLDTLAPTVRYECEKCGGRLADDPRTRHLITESGRFVALNLHAPPDIRSYAWTQLAMENLTWFSRIQLFLAAREQAKRGNDAPQREFFQKVMAEPYDPDKYETYQKLPTFKVEIIEGGKAWDKQDFIFLSVDVQLDHFWALVVAWTKAGEFLVLFAEKLFTWDDIGALQTRFKVPDQCVFVDAGHRQNEVYEHCVRHGHMDGRAFKCWWALKGSDQKEFVYTVRKNGKSKAIKLPYSWPAGRGDPSFGMHSGDPRMAELRGKYCPVVFWSNPTIKDVAKRRRDEIAKGGSRSLVADSVPEDFSKHLYSEKKVNDETTRWKWKWKRVGNRPNHLWDCFCENIVGAFMARIIGDAETPTDESPPGTT